MNRQNKLDRLIEAVRSKKRILVSFSGGLDSSLVARVAHDVLGDDSLAVTLDSETFPRAELVESERIAAEIGIRHRIVRTSALDNERFLKNPEDRCYHCKSDEMTMLKRIALEERMDCIADGVNASDHMEHRPGIRAADEAGVWHPLVEAGIEKSDARELAWQLGLSVHSKPSAACLSSRIPYGEEITGEKLLRIERSEEFLRSLGFGQLRVRSHGNIARIEVEERDISKFLSPELRRSIEERLIELGFRYVALDLKGYRSGSMDEVLPCSKETGGTK